MERARSSEIGFIFDSHESLFKNNAERDFLTLVVFVFYEHAKGERSFWHTFFEANDPGKMACYWDENVLKELDDSELVVEL